MSGGFLNYNPPQETIELTDDEQHDNLKKDVVLVIEKHGVKSIRRIKRIVEAVLIRSALATNSTSAIAADQLGIGKTTLYRKMREHGIPKKRTG